MFRVPLGCYLQLYYSRKNNEPLYNEVLDTERTIFSVTEIVKVMGEKNLVIANIFCQSLVHSLNRGFTVVFSTSFGSNWGHFMRFSVPMTIENTKTGTNKD